MKKVFKEILEVNDVHGVLVYTRDGELAYEEFISEVPSSVPEEFGKIFADSFHVFKEAEMIFDKKRLYFRKVADGYFIVVMSSKAPIAMVRLNSDIIAPSLTQIKKPKGFRLFRKK